MLRSRNENFLPINVKSVKSNIYFLILNVKNDTLLTGKGVHHD